MRALLPRQAAVLVIDSREQAPQRAVIAAANPDSTVEKLPSGDFKIIDKCGHRMGAERKEASDLLGSLSKEQNGDKRLHDQLKRMAAEYDYVMLITEGLLKHNPADHCIITPNGRLSGWRYGSVLAQLESIQASGVIVIQTSDLAGTAEWLRVLHSRAKRGCGVPTALRKGLKAA